MEISLENCALHARPCFPNRKCVHVQVSTQKPGLTDVERIKHSVSYETWGKVLERLALEYYQIDISTSLLELILKFGQLKNTLTQ